MSEPVRTLVVRGPFTVEQLRSLINMIATFESKAPDENFEVHVDDRGNDEADVRATWEMLNRIHPPRPGYTRVMGIFPNAQDQN